MAVNIGRPGSVQQHGNGPIFSKQVVQHSHLGSKDGRWREGSVRGEYRRGSNGHPGSSCPQHQGAPNTW
ncbi:hypothetical protein CHARACLAT_032506 [Characodon lateralis]|uniref:Uncharacterized protein n=1 Tax=Characodon lateralis TaxID=208331 RepID=A0ABU7CT57_9TELE|nr:hypothetical protein [Characodon lateralis]